jgi:TonB family protein
MTAKFFWDNLVAYSLQIGLLVALAAFVPAILRLRLPGAKLVYWHFLLVACLLLPVLGPRTRETGTSAVQVSSTFAVIAPRQPAPRPGIPKSEMALLLLASGVVIRLGWLGVGLWRLGQYRRHSQPLKPVTKWNAEADLRISGAIASPVTFGFRKPVVLLPARFPELDAQIQEAILCHEVLHVRRHDWLFTVAEELVRAVFWFHPAIWWLLGEIGLAREQAVDRRVIELTQHPEEYLDALLAIAGAKPQLDLAPAPLFLRKRHLKQRVISILKEVRMSKTRLISALTAGLGILAVACWFVTNTFPLTAAPQAPDGPGVAVDMGGAAVLHRIPVIYPEAARKQGVEGTVVMELTMDTRGSVSDARVLSGPVELRKAAIQSVLQWHLMKDAAMTTRQVRITFQLPAENQNRTVTVPAGQRVVEVGQASTAVLRESAPPPPPPPPPPPYVGAALSAAAQSAIIQFDVAGQRQVSNRQVNPLEGRKIARIDIAGLPDQARADLLSQLPVHEGDLFSPDLLSRTFKAARDFDEHLNTSLGRDPNGDLVLRITAPGIALAGTPIGGMTAAPPPDGTRRITIGGNVQQVKLISQTHPAYPSLAKQARIEGVVHLQAVIAADGSVKDLSVISGHPLLIPSALEAVRQWVYQTTLLNGEPVEVMTQIDVNYTLAQ